MKSKTIKQVLRKRFDEFVDSIDDPSVSKLVNINSIITGGSIASMLKGEQVNDFDVYFTDKQTVLAVCNYYIKKFAKENSQRPNFEVIDDGTRVKIRVKSAGVAAEDGFVFDEQEVDQVYDIDGNLSDGVTFQLDNAMNSEDTEDPGVTPSMTNPDDITYLPEDTKLKDKFRPVYISANAITLSDQFQLIIRFYGDAEEIHSNYDFAHCTCWWRSKDGHLELPSEALECLLTNELRYKGSKYPLASIIRTRKFINRGFTINAGQYLKMCMQLNDMDLRDLDTLEDQLIGVDALYFAQMLANIPNNAKIDNRIDSNYLIEMIDRFF